MFKALRVFEVREAPGFDYQVPSVDAVADATPPAVPVPAAPIMLHARLGFLSWTPVECDGFRVERRVGSLWEFVASLSSGQREFSNPIVTEGIYRVRAFNASGNGPASAGIEISGATPSAPVLTYFPRADGVLFPRLEWTYLPEAEFYRVYYREIPILGAPDLVLRDTTDNFWHWSSEDWPTTSGGTILVRAVNQAGESPDSNEVLFEGAP